MKSEYNTLEIIIKDDESIGSNYPIEFFNKQPSGMTKDDLKLKKGVVVMLISNMDPDDSLSGMIVENIQ